MTLAHFHQVSGDETRDLYLNPEMIVAVFRAANVTTSVLTNCGVLYSVAETLEESVELSSRNILRLQS